MFCVNYIKRNVLDLVLLRNTSETNVRKFDVLQIIQCRKLLNFGIFSLKKATVKIKKVHGKKLDICLKNASNFSLYRRGYIRFARGLLINPIKRRQNGDISRHFSHNALRPSPVLELPGHVTICRRFWRHPRPAQSEYNKQNFFFTKSWKLIQLRDFHR